MSTIFDDLRALRHELRGDFGRDYYAPVISRIDKIIARHESQSPAAPLSGEVKVVEGWADWPPLSGDDVVIQPWEESANLNLPPQVKDVAILTRADFESLARDAARYRHMRKAPLNGGRRDWLYMPHTQELDAAVDDAIRRGETP